MALSFCMMFGVDVTEQDLRDSLNTSGIILPSKSKLRWVINNIKQNASECEIIVGEDEEKEEDPIT